MRCQGSAPSLSACRLVALSSLRRARFFTVAAKEDIARNVKEELQKSMSTFGFQVGGAVLLLGGSRWWRIVEQAARRLAVQSAVVQS